jgi:acyl dehydratase
MTKTLGLATDIDDEGYASVLDLVGKPIRVEPYNHEATRDTIRHYSFGIGDDNPLFCDPEYGRRSPFGDIIAPPTFLYSVFDGAIGAGLAGVQPVYSGTRWLFRSRVARNAAVDVQATFGRVRRLSGRTARDMLIQEADCTYLVDGVPVATAVAGTFRLPRRTAEGGGLSYEPREEYQYSPAEIARIEADALGEFRRGAAPLDVTALRVDDEVPKVVKGPIDRITMTAYYAGCIGSPGYKACELAWKYRHWAHHDPEKLPNNYDPSYYAETVLPSLGHQDPDVAREIGMPNAYDNGPQRCGWFGSAVTNWMGDNAFLAALEIKLRRPDIFGDTLWIGGHISAVEEHGEHGVVEVRLAGVNQLEEVTASAVAHVVARLDGDPVMDLPADLAGRLGG